MSLDHATTIVKHQTPTRDAFLGGRLLLAQPASGFRAGLDSVLLGAAVATAEGALLDLGSGVGTAAFVALSHHPALLATLVDLDAESLEHARQNIADNGFAPRAKTLALDVTAAGAVRTAAGLLPDHFSVVIANPPFFAAGEGTLPKSRGRAAARHMAAAALDAWVRTAAGAAAPGGEVIFIHAVQSLPALLASFEQRLGAITVLPFAPRPGEPATRILVRGRKGSRAPLRLLPQRSIHGPAGASFAPEIEAVLRGVTPLLW